MLPERSHYFDVGVTQQRAARASRSASTPTTRSPRDLLDDGQFGAAYVLTAFNYDKRENVGVELKANYKNGNFSAYGNIAVARQLATNVVSNQFLFAADELAYIANHYIYTDHAQLVSGSAGASYLWNGTRFSADMIYGSGLRSGFANTDSLPWYSQVNLGISHEFKWTDGTKPTTLRFDVVNAVRHDLPDQGRLRHRRVRAAIRPAPRLFRRHLAEILSRMARRMIHEPERTDHMRRKDAPQLWPRAWLVLVAALRCMGVLAEPALAQGRKIRCCRATCRRWACSSMPISW